MENFYENKSTPFSVSVHATKFFILVASTFALFGMPLSSSAIGIGAPPGTPSPVVYSTDVKNVQLSDITTQSYSLTITAPALVPLATPFNVNLSVVVVSVPTGADPVAAATYVSLSNKTLSYSSLQSANTITVTVTMPSLSGTSSLDYAYKIVTTGWPTGSTYSVVDGFSFINVHQDPPSGLQAPIIAIASPADQSIYTYLSGGSDVLVPINVSAAGSSAAPVLTLVATINGPGLADTPLNLLLTGLGTPSAAGVVQGDFPANISGTYIITATATNDVNPDPVAVTTATSTSQSTFYVKTVVGPSVVIDQPPVSTTYYLGDPALSIPFHFAGHSNSSVITQLTATINGNPVSFVTTNLGTIDASGAGTFDITPTASGSYTLDVTASDIYGTPATQAVFTINIVGPNPTIAIGNPLNNASFTIPSGATNLNIPFTFTTNSLEPHYTISSISAVLDPATSNVTLNVSNTAGLNTVTAVTSGNMASVTAGSHTLQVTGTSGGVNVSAVVNFTVSQQVVVLSSPPIVMINTPAPGATYSLSGSSSSTGSGSGSSSGCNWGGWSNDLGSCGTSYKTDHSDYCGSSNFYSDDNCDKGTSSSCKDISSGYYGWCGFTNKTTSTNCSTSSSGGGSVTIPMTFTGKSTTAGAVITAMTAKLDSTTIAWTTPTGDVNKLGTAIADGSSSLVVTTAGVHTITVTATDAYGTATVSQTFTVTATSAGTVSGKVFFDVNYNGKHDVADYGLSGVSISLQNWWGRTITSTTTGADGTYTFQNVASGSYVVVSGSVQGMSPTTINEIAIRVSGTSSVIVSEIGYGLDFAKLKRECSDGNTSDYWKTNLDNRIKGKSCSNDVTTAELDDYTSKIATHPQQPCHGKTISQNRDTLSTKSKTCTDLLKKELTASEYNCANGRFIGGNAGLTCAFVYWAEYVVSNPTIYNNTYVTYAKNWCAAYNNSTGGYVNGP